MHDSPETGPQRPAQPEDPADAELLGLLRRDLDREALWHARAAGELDSEAARERASALGDAPEDIERAEQFFSPFAESERESLVDALLAMTGGDAATAGLADQVDQADQPGTPTTALEHDQTPAHIADNVVSLAAAAQAKEAKEAEEPQAATSLTARLAGTGPWWWVPGGLLIAAAAAIVAWVFWPPSQELLDSSGGSGQLVADASGGPMPAYQLETDGGLKQLRSEGESSEGEPNADTKPHDYRRGSKFEWILRPREAVEGELEVRAFAFAGQRLDRGLPLALAELVEISPSGSVRVAGTIGQLGLEPGAYTIALLVGRPGSLPSDAGAVREGGEDGSWQIHRIAIAIAP
ncbi:hypothetical protein G6O69_09455 [Pseudenhygromyxa sp. WMMC2535]|uniref:hypothetical protein n=1 Tax=Pseudenhygromyxa sp. WMMC2535 TaxID=2712867 RepID=UPI001551A3C5|nr:hypothetical protein [Pseudenhygromyxa sp. WMMC2535]NVB38057.1 hypothetical protein [Pseudenhygromyxa sp. WMMC2535]